MLVEKIDRRKALTRLKIRAEEVRKYSTQNIKKGYECNEVYGKRWLPRLRQMEGQKKRKQIIM